MAQFISAVTLVVSDYDLAIDFYVNKMGFTLECDISLPDNKRWVMVLPPSDNPNSTGCALLLAKATSDVQALSIGNQTGGQVFLFLTTNDFDHDYRLMLEKSITFLEAPRDEPYGKVVVFSDPFGNKWDLIEPA